MMMMGMLYSLGLTTIQVVNVFLKDIVLWLAQEDGLCIPMMMVLKAR